MSKDLSDLGVISKMLVGFVWVFFFLFCGIFLCQGVIGIFNVFLRFLRWWYWLLINVFNGLI